MVLILAYIECGKTTMRTEVNQRVPPGFVEEHEATLVDETGSNLIEKAHLSH